ncbi:hypothetical protein [Chryseobacterium sp. CT-SW4]|uniref:hypothetical protein n=1 Tax=Chryseobacterium sp. SW-1 TaxID=3157343 RepID=UPI003B028881
MKKKSEKKLSLKKIQMAKISNPSKIVGGKIYLIDDSTCGDPENTSKPKETIIPTA